MNKYKAKKFPFLYFVAGGLLLLFAAWYLSPPNRGGEATPQPPTLAVGHGEETYPEIERVSLEDARAALEAGDAIIVDVRSVEAYAAGHIPGALNIPSGEIESRLGELDPDQWIITYCT